jgi:hypothetical protein
MAWDNEEGHCGMLESLLLLEIVQSENIERGADQSQQ